MKVLLLSLSLGLAGAAAASEAPLQLVGQARLQFLFWPVYDSSLYSADGSYQEGQRPLRLEITYLRDIAADDLVARTAVEWEAQGLFHSDQQQWLQDLAKLWPDVRAGDTLALELNASERSTFYHNGRELGGPQGTAFGRHFLAIWLSPETSRPEIRRELIGQR